MGVIRRCSYIFSIFSFIREHMCLRQTRRKTYFTTYYMREKRDIYFLDIYEIWKIIWSFTAIRTLNNFLTDIRIIQFAVRFSDSVLLLVRVSFHIVVSHDNLRNVLHLSLAFSLFCMRYIGAYVSQHWRHMVLQESIKENTRRMKWTSKRIEKSIL